MPFSRPAKRRKLCPSPENSITQAKCCSRCNESTQSSNLTNDLIKKIPYSHVDDNYTFNTDCRYLNLSSRSEKMAEAGEVESKERTAKMPTEAELEEFFSAAEKQIHKQFTDKYNFDIDKEVPLKGRYEWVKIRP